MNIQALLSQLTLEEKATLCIGGSYYHTAAISRLQIPSIRVNDGPSGINLHAAKHDDLLSDIDPLTAILFPSSSCTCCSFDPDLLYFMGENFGDEMVKEGVSILLGPGANIKRSPLCGRNFEYFSEDPYLSSKIAGSLIRGIQSKGVGCCIKHFAANNQEFCRLFYSAEIDERTLREIYLMSFELAIREAKPWAVMTSYNQINEVYSSDNFELITNILRDQWKWNINDQSQKPLSGIVMSDWDGTYDTIEGLKAGLDLQMPGPFDVVVNDIVEFVQEDQNNEKFLNQSVERILNVVSKAQNLIERSKSDPSIQFGKRMIKIDGYLDQQHQVATRVAENSIVLLKNENSILPLPTICSDSKGFKVLFVGEFAANPHERGYGSAFVEPYNLTNPLESSISLLKQEQEKEEENQNKVEISYIKGFDLESDEIVGSVEEVIESSKNSDVVVVFAGTPKYQETEGKDRKNINLPIYENEMIFEILKVNKNVVIVLQNGSPVGMPWVNDVKAILETYFAGEGCGEATAKILFGLVNPSGHLAETFPLRIEDNPSYGNFGQKDIISYKENIFVGYRHYDSKNIEVLFPFGYGLSYTTFEYKNIRLNQDDNVVKFKKHEGENDDEIVSVDVVNTGDRVGKTVAQLYVSDLVQQVQSPLKELKGFEKVELNPGEIKTVVFNLNKRAFAWWNVKIHDWFVSDGNYKIIVGQSSRDEKSLILDLQIQIAEN